jgi:equilibrative nucleoside transporter 3
VSHFKDLALIAKSIPWYILAILLIFFISSSIYPTLVVLAVPSHPSTSTWTGSLFVPIFGILSFNLGDFIGRLTSKIFKLSNIKSYYLSLLATFRILIAIGIIFCNLKPRSNLRTLIFCDYYYMGFVVALGFTQGFLIITTVTEASKHVSSRLREKTGFVISLAFSLAITFGSIFANFLITHI